MSKNIYIVWSLKRSGAHGFEEWLFPHFSNYGFVNNTNIRQPLSRGASAADKDNIIFGFEDIKLDVIPGFNNGTDGIIKQNISDFDTITNILFIRDPYNLFASRLRKNQDDKRMFMDESTVRLWKGYAKEAIGETSYLSNKVVVNFGRWYTIREYRNQISEKLGLEFTDEGIKKVGIRGSSFDGKKIKNSRNLGVLERWTEFIGNEEYNDLINDEELASLYRQVNEIGI